MGSAKFKEYCALYLDFDILCILSKKKHFLGAFPSILNLQMRQRSSLYRSREGIFRFNNELGFYLFFQPFIQEILNH